MEIALAILKAIAAIPKIADWVDELVARHIANLEERRRKRIAEANIDLAMAKTKEEKDAALLKRFGAGSK